MRKKRYITYQALPREKFLLPRHQTSKTSSRRCDPSRLGLAGCVCIARRSAGPVAPHAIVARRAAFDCNRMRAATGSRASCTSNRINAIGRSRVVSSRRSCPCMERVPQNCSSVTSMAAAQTLLLLLQWITNLTESSRNASATIKVGCVV